MERSHFHTGMEAPSGVVQRRCRSSDVKWESVSIASRCNRSVLSNRNRGKKRKSPLRRNQDRSAVSEDTPKGIELNFKVYSKGPACVVDTNNRFIQVATEALHEIFKKDTVFIRSGGSIPVVTDFQEALKIPSVMMGFGLPDDNLHAPNEKFHIPNFYRGIESIIRFFEKLGE